MNDGTDRGSRRETRERPKVRQYGVSLRCSVPVALLVALSVWLVPLAPALSQARSLDELSRADDPIVAREQADYVARLKAFAAGKAKGNSTVYWQIIRANLASKKGSLAGSGERSLSGGNTASFRLPSAREAVPVDASTIKTLQAAIDRIENGERIFGGRQTRSDEFREVVSIAERNGNAFNSFCTGTLIDKETVLTAAHCVCKSSFTGPPGTRPAVVFGTDVNRPDKVDSAFEVKSAVTRDASFCQHGKIVGRDLAVIKFNPSEPITGTRKDSVQPIKIASWQLMLGLGMDELDLVGFGYTESNELGEKRFATTPIMDRLCSAKAVQAYQCALGQEIVAIDYQPDAEQPNRDTCNGDSGGPALLRDGSGDYYLVGVTSRGATKGGACGAGGIYSLVTPAVIRWLIEDHRVDVRLCIRPDNAGC